MSATLTLAVVLAVAVPLALWRAYRRDEGSAEQWARERELALTEENRPLVVRHVRTARIFRAWGGVAGALLPSLAEFAWNGRVQVLGFGTDGDSAPLAFGWIFVGYLVAAICAEVALARPARTARRTASLALRELQDYLPRWAVAAQRVLSVAAALGVLAIGLLPYDPGFSTPALPALLLGAAAVLGFGAGLEAVERWLVRRPQPFTSTPVVDADERDPRAVHPDHRRGGPGAAAPVLLRRRARSPGLRRGGAARDHGRPGGGLLRPLAARVPWRRPAIAAASATPPRRVRDAGVILEVDSRSPVAPYEQLRQQITALVLAGGLAPGDRLPSIRQLANDLGIAGGTVARAYRELESDGVVSTRGRHGTVVEGPPRRPAPPPELLAGGPRVRRPGRAERRRPGGRADRRARRVRGRADGVGVGRRSVPGARRVVAA